MANREFTGSVEAFEANWTQRQGNHRYHFKRGSPSNQIQFAFQNHWRVFQRVLGNKRSGRALEVGCGRGSMAAFFADAGFDVHLMDTSETVLRIARANFAVDELQGHCTCGDALALPYPLETFDVILSIGLLEHFADIEQPLLEQMRVLKPGGTLLCYVVPGRPLSVQVLAIPVNAVLRLGHWIRRGLRFEEQAQTSRQKTLLYRNDYAASDYLAILQQCSVQESGSFGMFPVPLISHSPGFPFSLMSPRFERALVWLWQRLLAPSAGQRKDPWTCPERWGLAFLVWARKVEGHDARE